MSIINCLGTKLPPNIMKEVREIHAEQMKRFNGDVGMADAELVRIVEVNTKTKKAAKIRSALKLMAVEKEVTEALALENTLYNGLTKAGRGARKLFRRSPSYIRTYVDRTINRVDLLADTRINNALEEIPAFVHLKAKRPAHKDPEAWKEFVRGLNDGPNVVKDPEVRLAVTEYRNWMSKSEDGMRGAGLNVGHIPNYIPVRHNFERIAKVDEGAWKRAMNEHSDLARVYNLRQHRQGVDAEEFDRITSAMFRRARDGDVEMAARDIRSERTGFKRSTGDLWGRHASNRIFQPKSAESYIAYIDEFGDGVEHLDNTFLYNIHSVERDIATADVMGPTPLDMHKKMLSRGVKEGATRPQQQFAHGMFETAINQWEGSVDNYLSRGWQTFQNFASFNLLGSAPMAAIGDQALIGNVRRLYGLIDGGGRTTEFLRTFTGSRADALRGAELAELMARTTVGRFDAVQDGKLLSGMAQKSDELQTKGHYISGLHTMTKKASDQMTGILFSSLSEKVGKQADWNSLTPEMKGLMNTVGMGEPDWQRLLTFDVDGMPDGFITPNRVKADDPDLAMKLKALDVGIRRIAVNAPDLFTRNLATGRFAGARSHGDPVHLLMSSVMQFKSFPVQIWRHHFVPAMLRMTDSTTMTGAIGGALPIGIATVEAAFFGMIALQLKQIASGNPLLPMDSTDTLRRSIMQGGLYGLLGDIMMQDPTGYKASVVGALAGPTASISETALLTAMDTVWKLGDGDPETSPSTAKIANALRPFVPGQSLWYLKAGWKKGMDSAFETLDPDYYDVIERRQQRMREERGAGTLAEQVGNL
jgi:hypothetical protein